MAECSDGDLIVVCRYFSFHDTNREEYDVRTIGFKVYKLDLLNLSWIEVKNIGGDILFLGFNSARPISSNDLPGCKGNYIYFLDSNLENDKNLEPDIGVFNLECGAFESLQGMRQPFWPKPVWVNMG